MFQIAIYICQHHHQLASKVAVSILRMNHSRFSRMSADNSPKIQGTFSWVLPEYRIWTLFAGFVRDRGGIKVLTELTLKSFGGSFTHPNPHASQSLNPAPLKQGVPSGLSLRRTKYSRRVRQKNTSSSPVHSRKSFKTSSWTSVRDSFLAHMLWSICENRSTSYQINSSRKQGIHLDFTE